MGILLSALYNILPDLAGILLATFAFAFLFLPEILKKLERYKVIRFGLFFLIILIGIGGVISSQKQKAEFTKQINTLLNAYKTQATIDDVRKIGTDMQVEMRNGFDRVIAAIKGKPVPPQPIPSPTPTIPTPTVPVPTIENTRLIQKPTISDKAEFPYGLQVIIQSNVVLQPIALGIECDGDIGDFNFFISGQAVYMNVFKRVSGKNAELRFSFPSLTPESALIVTILSKTQIRVVKVYKLNS